MTLSDDEKDALHRHWLSLLTCPRDQMDFIRDAIDRLLDRIADERANGRSWHRAMCGAMQLDVESL